MPSTEQIKLALENTVNAPRNNSVQVRQALINSRKNGPVESGAVKDHSHADHHKRITKLYTKK